MRRLLLLLVLGAGLSPSGVHAQLMEDPTLPAERTHTVEGPLFSAPSDPGLEAIWNLQFARADSIYAARKKADPGSPEGVFGLGLSMWWQLVSGLERVDPDELEKTLKRVGTVSKRYAERPGKRGEALYYSGRAQSLLSSFYLIKGSMMSAFRAGQRSRSYLLACLDESPEFEDAKLGLGLYHYYTDALPSFFKVIGWVFGVRGDRERGLRELREAAAHGPRTHTEAAYFLSNVLTNFEGRPDEGLNRVRWLAQRYPHNHVFFLEYQNALESLGYYPEAEAAMRAALASGGAFEDVRAVRLMLGRNLYRQARYEEGAVVLEPVLARRPDKNDPVEPWFYYFAGRCRDLMGDTSRARDHYETAKSYDIGGNVSGLAKDRLENPESESERRLRVARGLTRQRGRAAEAAEQWAAIAADMKAGTFDTSISIDQVQFRRALSLEEAGRYADAEAAFGSVEEGDMSARAALGAARCAWRSGDTARARAALESLSARRDSDAAGKARSLLGVLDKDPCSAIAGSADRRFRDTEAWDVAIIVSTDDGETCYPMSFRDGLWVGAVPESLALRPYHFDVDGMRQDPDPLGAWTEGKSGQVWTLAAALLATESPPWLGRLVD